MTNLFLDSHVWKPARRGRAAITAALGLGGLLAACSSAPTASVGQSAEPVTTGACAGQSSGTQKGCSVEPWDNGGESGTSWTAIYYCNTDPTPVDNGCPAGQSTSYNACTPDPSVPGAYACQQNCTGAPNFCNSPGVNSTTCSCQSACTKVKCTTLNNTQCGDVPDGCGGTLNCSCSGGLDCENGYCVPGCTPKDEQDACAAAGNGKSNAACTGTADDGCGVPYFCSQSDCESGQVCGSSGLCVTPPACTPLTQGDVCKPLDCYSVYPDGCGGTIDCGSDGCPSSTNPCTTNVGSDEPDGLPCQLLMSEDGFCSNGTCTVGT
jgi:hypothetical protein